MVQRQGIIRALRSLCHCGRFNAAEIHSRSVTAAAVASVRVAHPHTRPYMEVWSAMPNTSLFSNLFSSSSRSSSRSMSEPFAAASAHAHMTAAATDVMGSAAASAAAAFQAEIQALQRVGLERAAAAAVHEAWHAGRIKAFRTDADAFFHERIADIKHSSPRKLLMRIRKLLQAHNTAAAAATETAVSARPAATAAAAAAAPPATASLPWRTRAQLKRRTLAQTNLASGASGVSSEGPASHIGWGAVDIQQVISNEPGLLMVPWQELASRLETLLNGIAPLLGRDLAVQYVHKSRHLRLQLSNPVSAIGKLQAMRDAYADIVGVLPKPSLLAASQSSFMNSTIPKFKRKLRYFVDRWGAETAHTSLSHQPHLLASKSSSLDNNGEALQQLLGCSRQELERVVRKAPRLLSTDMKLVAGHYQELLRLLEPLGVAADDVRRLVLKMPALLSLNPVTTAAKLEAFKGLLGSSGHRLRICITQQPNLLAFSSQTLSDRFDDLQELLGCRRDDVCALIASAPSVLSFVVDVLADRVQELAQVLGLSVQQTKDLCCRDGHILTVTPKLFDVKITSWAAALQLSKADVVDVMLSYPRMLTYDVDAVVAHTKALQALVARSELWSQRSSLADASGNKLTHAVASPSKPGFGEGMQVLAGRQSYFAFLRTVKEALREEFPEMSRRERHKLAQARWREQKELAQQQQQQQQLQVPPQSLTSAWALKYSRNISGRLLLRLEYLLATGQQEKVSLARGFRDSEQQWTASFPDYPDWAQLRLQHLQQDPSEWPEVLVKKAVTWYGASNAGDSSTPTRADQARRASRTGRLAAAARAAEGAA